MRYGFCILLMAPVILCASTLILCFCETAAKPQTHKTAGSRLFENSFGGTGHAKRGFTHAQEKRAVQTIKCTSASDFGYTYRYIIKVEDTLLWDTVNKFAIYSVVFQSSSERNYEITKSLWDCDTTSITYQWTKSRTCTRSARCRGISNGYQWSLHSYSWSSGALV